MTNIEKLYELAKATKYRAVSIYNPIVGYGDYETIEEASSYGDGFKVEKINSKFTDTKQLELIKWLAFEKRVSIKFLNGKWSLYTAEMGISASAKYEPFEQLLADFICNLWEDLTDTQREEIKRILE